MELRRYKCVSGMAGLPENVKRQKIDFSQYSNTSTTSSSGNSSGSVSNREAEDSGSDVSFNSSNGDSSNGSTIDNVSEVDASQPKDSAVEIDKLVSDRCPKYGVTSVCGRRREMEDAIAIHPSFCKQNIHSPTATPSNLHFFGVYDGHGCSHVATSCKDRMHDIVKEEIGRGSAWKEIMEQSYSRMDKEVLGWNQGKANMSCRCELQAPKCDAGSTAVVSIVTPEKIITANCGDSRAVLCRSGKAIPLSTDHKPDRPDELKRIQDAGGRVIYWDGARVLGVLAMSRAIGDDYLKPYVCSDPELTITDRTVEDDCLILASDGLWDVLSNETVCSIAKMCLNGHGPNLPANVVKSNSVEGSDKACSDAALLLTKLAMARNTTDNVSVIVVDLRRNT